MQEQAKISLSDLELKLVTNADFILTKNGIIAKVCQLFGSICEVYLQNEIINQLSLEVLQIPPKISKGENYNGLPYVMLDYPRFFGKEDVLAVRSFFWWGHFFSCTLQIKGRFKEQYQHSIVAVIKTGILDGCFINTSDEEWDHDIPGTMKKITPDDAKTIATNQLIKIASVLPLNQWRDAELFFASRFRLYAGLLQS